MDLEIDVTTAEFAAPPLTESDYQIPVPATLETEGTLAPRLRQHQCPGTTTKTQLSTSPRRTAWPLPQRHWRRRQVFDWIGARHRSPSKASQPQFTCGVDGTAFVNFTESGYTYRTFDITDIVIRMQRRPLWPSHATQILERFMAGRRTRSVSGSSAL